MVKVAYTVGRFQPPTIGHALLIEAVMKNADKGHAYVFVSSSRSPKGQNPLTVDQKIAALTAMFPSGVNFVNTATCGGCGGPVAANDYLRRPPLAYTDITLVAGSDRAGIFGPTGEMWNAGIANGVPPPKFVGLVRTEGSGATSMSGTKARALALAGDTVGFTAAVKVGSIGPEAIEKLYNAIRNPEPISKQKGGDIDENFNTFEADDEPIGGRRRKTRRRYGSKRIRRTRYGKR